MNRDVARSLGLCPKLNEDAVPTIDVANVQAAPTEMTRWERKQVRVFLNHFRPMEQEPHDCPNNMVCLLVCLLKFREIKCMIF